MRPDRYRNVVSPLWQGQPPRPLATAVDGGTRRPTDERATDRGDCMAAGRRSATPSLGTATTGSAVCATAVPGFTETVGRGGIRGRRRRLDDPACRGHAGTRGGPASGVIG